MAWRGMAVAALWTSLLVQGGAVQAQGDAAVQKLKTGILPDGGLYSLYRVQCPDGSDASVASLERRARWCTLQGEQLLCARSAREIGDRACAASGLASRAGAEEGDSESP